MKSYSFRQINEDGYRGKKIDVAKQEGSYRILFMGGSTTYSIRVHNPDSTYPEIIHKKLQLQLKTGKLNNPNIKNIEVINAGLPWGTSAEIMTHYLFKFRYYNPDLIVINTGGNDAWSHFMGSEYQPDYSHFRKSMTNIPALPKNKSWIFKSKFVSYFILIIFFDEYVQGGHFVHEGKQRQTQWYKSKKTPSEEMEILEFNAFYQNLHGTINAMKADSTDILLVPFLADWSNDQYAEPELLEVHMFYDSLLHTIARETGVGFAPFTPDIIHDQSWWIDDCHLSPQGSEVKAEHIIKYILPYLERKDSVAYQ